jgi:hypothetical protein
MVGPDEELFVELYTSVEGDFYDFNELLADRGEERITMATFYRRRKSWITGVVDSKTTVSDEDRITKDLEDARPVAGGTVYSPDRRRGSLKGKRFVFTSAQNNSFVHEQFWDSLRVYCEHNGAQLVVGKFKYNKNGYQNNKEKLFYDPKIAPYVINESMVLEEDINKAVWCGELNISPTASNPLSGLDSYTHTASSIIPHAKVQLKSIAVLKGDPTKMLYTTGTCTQRNYIPQKAGQKADFHHVFGAIVVEIDEYGNAFKRQLIADMNGEFYDLTKYYTPHGVTEIDGVEGINWGDIHAEMEDPINSQVQWGAGPDSILNVLRPKYQFANDLTDFKARNHHNLKDPMFLAAMHWNGTGNVEDGMLKAAETLADMERPWCKTVVVESNHDQAFRRWLSEANIIQDPENAYYFHKYNMIVHNAIRRGVPIHVFEQAVREQAVLDHTIFLNEDDSFVIGGHNGIECGMHGHRGINGARGTANGFRQLGRKCNLGHAHSACIIDGIYVAGIACMMDLGYNKGPSSWSVTIIVTYPNGKRALVTITNGRWRA